LILVGLMLSLPLSAAAGIFVGNPADTFAPRSEAPMRGGIQRGTPSVSAVSGPEREGGGLSAEALDKLHDLEADVDYECDHDPTAPECQVAEILYSSPSTLPPERTAGRAWNAGR
jgi:hypothetical protein